MTRPGDSSPSRCTVCLIALSFYSSQSIKSLCLSDDMHAHIHKARVDMHSAHTHTHALIRTNPFPPFTAHYCPHVLMATHQNIYLSALATHAHTLCVCRLYIRTTQQTNWTKTEDNHTYVPCSNAFASRSYTHARRHTTHSPTHQHLIHTLSEPVPI